MSMEIGHRLRQARESMGYTLEEMARETQIHVSYLAALEAGDWNNLPSPYYTRAYLRTYGSRLGLDPKSLVQHVRRTGSANSRRSSRLSQQTGPHRREQALPMGLPPGEGGQRGVSRRGKHDRQKAYPEMAAEETAVAQQMPSRGMSGARRPTLPPDMPEPQELGLPPRTKARQTIPTSPVTETNHDQLRTQQRTPPEGSNALSRSSRSKQRGKERKSSKQTLMKWHTRLLKWGTVLFVLAALVLLWLIFFSDEAEPVKQGASEQTAEKAAAEGDGVEAEESTPSSDAVLTPIESEGNSDDRYELAHADSIELHLTASGECWFQIRNQEEGGVLEDKMLSAGDTFPFSYKDGNTLWLQLGNSANVDITVNGNKVNTSDQGGKQIQINRVN